MKKLLLIMAAAGILLTACGETQPAAPGKYAELAKCLTSKGVIMYGAYWCPHCKAQKEAFGGDFQFIKYQECAQTDDEQIACRQAGVTSYPTWFFPGQGNLVGEQSFADLAQRANCSDKLSADAAKPTTPETSTTAAPATTPATTPTTTSAPAATTSAPTATK